MFTENKQALNLAVAEGVCRKVRTKDDAGIPEEKYPQYQS
jgi:hypothetical protein